MTETLKLLVNGFDLEADSAESIMSEIISGQIRPEQVGAFLATLHFRPPTSRMLAGFARAFRKHTVSVPLNPEIANDVVDVCGTGGDGLQSFNVSTAVAFVTAASGQPVAKHGNRAVSSRCGSFDVLEALGVPFADTPEEATQSLRRHRLAFMYAPSFHPALRELTPVRRALGFRTVFNVLGPLLNPAGVRRQLVGVYSPDLVEPVAETLGELGAIEAMVVHGADGADELSISAPTKIAHLRDGRVQIRTVAPENFGLNRAVPESIAGADPMQNARILANVLSGEPGPRRDMVILNAAAALVVGGRAHDLQEGVKIARTTLESGKARALLDEMKEALSLGAVQ